MSERARERLFLCLSVVVLAVGGANLPRFAQTPWPFGGGTSRLLFLLVIIAALPATLVLHLVVEFVVGLAMLRRPVPGLLFRNPTASAEHAVTGSVEQVTARVAERLAGLGFPPPEIREAGPGEVVVSSSKPAKPQVHAFLDNAFDATVHLRPDRGRTHVRVDLTERAFILIETGERAKVREVAAHVALRQHAYDVRGVPLTAYVALTLAWAGVLTVALLPEIRGVWQAAAGLSLFGGAVFGGVAVVAILRTPGQLFGCRLAAAALLLGLAPFGVRAYVAWRGFDPAGIDSALWPVVPLIAVMFGTIFFTELRARQLAGAGRVGGPVRRGVRRAVGWGAAFGLVCVGMGGALWLDATRMTVRWPLSARQIETGDVRPGGWVGVIGFMDVARSRWVESRGQGRQYYIPVVSGRHGEPVCAVFRMSAEQFDEFVGEAESEFVAGDFGGIAYASVDEKVRAQFEHNGIPLADPCVEIEYGITPVAYGLRARPPLWIGGGLLGAVLILAAGAALYDVRHPAAKQANGRAEPLTRG